VKLKLRNDRPLCVGVVSVCDAHLTDGGVSAGWRIYESSSQPKSSSSPALYRSEMSKR
jgi:hypothetical protein